MTRVFRLVPSSEDTEEHLWKHRLYIEDAYAVLDEGRYKVFPNKGYKDRVLLIGPDAANRLLTFVVSVPDNEGAARIITGRPATTGERTRFERPGGTQHA